MGFRDEFLVKLEALRALGLSEGQYLIWGSGPLAMRGLRLGRDVDLLVTRDVWEKLAQKHEVGGEKKNVILLREVEVWGDCMNLTGRVDEMIEDCDWIEGFPFMKLGYVVEWKRWLGREKDLRDVALIEEHLMIAQ